MVSPNSAHTAANLANAVDGLRDGDVFTSPSLTNLVEAGHGNGIIRLQDTAYEMSARNDTATNSPGHCVRASTHVVTVHGGYAVLDGVLYSFAGGPGQNAAITLDNTLAHCRSTALGSGQEVLYAIYLIGSSNGAHSSAHIRVSAGAPTTSSSGVFPPVADGFLTNPNPVLGAVNEKNGHSICLAVVRCIYNAAGGNDACDVVEVNDKRVFISTSPKYITPITRGTTTANANTVVRTNNTGINTDVQLKEVFGSADENGDFGGSIGGERVDVSAMWVSHQNWDTPVAAPPVAGDADYGLGITGGRDNTATDTPTDVLYFSGQGNAIQSAAAGGAMFTTRLGSRGVDVGTWTKGSAGLVAWPITSYGDSVFIINVATGGSTLNLVPTGEFPEGHMIDVKLSGGAGALQFAGNAVATYEKWVYDGTSWYQLV